MEEPITLSAQKGVLRTGNTVRRPAKPWSGNIAAFVRHLDGQGLPVERFEGFCADTGEELWQFGKGELVHPGPWSDDALFEVGALAARLHRGALSFHPETGQAAPWYLREIGKNPKIWCHGDIAPWNMLTENGRPTLLVDWEFSGPLDPMVELSRICWLFCQLHDDDLMDLHHLPDAAHRAKQVRMVCDGYGLCAPLRHTLLEQILETVICETAHEAIDEGLTFESRGELWGFAWRTRSLYWIWRNRSLLTEALQ